MVTKTKWFRQLVKEHGMTPYFVLWLVIGFFAITALESLWVAWPKFNVSHFFVVWLADIFYYMRIWGSLAVAGFGAYFLGVNFNSKIVGWILFVVILFAMMLAVDFVAKEIPEVGKHYKLFIKHRNAAEPLDWY